MKHENQKDTLSKSKFIYEMLQKHPNDELTEQLKHIAEIMEEERKVNGL